VGGEGEGVLMLLVGKALHTSSTTGVRKDTVSCCSASGCCFQSCAIAESAYPARALDDGIYGEGTSRPRVRPLSPQRSVLVISIARVRGPWRRYLRGGRGSLR
jgi:hypothetical protein